jgi:putative inorganic carbon (HCO3(-)) transporter
MITYPRESLPSGKRFTGPIDALKRNTALIALALWVFMPFIRRLVQWPTSYSAGNALTLVPPLFAIIAFVCIRRSVRIPKFTQFAVVCTTFAFLYSLVLAILMGNYIASFYTFIDFMAPMYVAAVVCSPKVDDPIENIQNTYHAFLKAVAYVTLIVAVYGIAQYLMPTVWDAKWMVDSRMRSIGLPKPFMVRVFSVLNSPGVLGAYLAVAMLYLIPLARRAPILAYSTLILSAVTFLLSMLRAGWVASLGGLVVYFIFSEQRITLIKTLVFAVAALGVTTIVLQNTPGFDKPIATLGQRLNTLGDVEHDVSAIDRENQIRIGGDMTQQNPIGYGLGIFGMAASINSYDGTNALIDHGYLARILELGWPGFAGYLAPFFGAAALCCMSLLESFQRVRRPSLRTDHLALAAGSLASMLILNGFGDFDRGITAFIGWAAIFFFVSLSAPSPQTIVENRPYHNNLSRLG